MSYYSIERFNNWIERIRGSHIDFNDPESLVVFDRMMEDLVVACLNVIKAVRSRELTKREAIKEFEEMEKIVMSDVGFEDPVKKEFFELIREGLKTIVYSARYCVEGKLSKKSFENLIKDAIKKEGKGDLKGAFDTVARLGAKVFRGERLPKDVFAPENSIVLNWLDGVDIINTVMLLMEIDSSEEQQK
ncbi:MAG: DUF2150 domain-containing protein [Archaeoglobus sp.]|jgi:hypothetical protein|nr:MAG: DUF2150 domain-containing protein [Archaeoglobus sp.]